MNDVYRNASELSEPEKVRQAILLVDDRVENLVALEAILDDGSLLLLRAQSGEEALQILLEHEVALVLLDVAMPGMDGYALCKLFRQNAQMVDTPVIMLSGKDGFFNKIRGKMSGSTMFLSKPFQPEGLLRVVQTYCPVESRSAGASH